MSIADVALIVISASAVIVALAALCLAIFEGRATRKHNREQAEATRKHNREQAEATRTHNRLSVKPILDFTEYGLPLQGKLGIYLTNKGVGPAIIRERLQISVNGKVLPNDPNPGKQWDQATNMIGLDSSLVRCLCLDVPANIAQGETLVLYSAALSKMTKEAQEDFAQRCTQIGIRVVYESVYGDEFEETHESLQEVS